MRILYKLTTRSRPKLAERAIRSVIENSVSDDYYIWVTLDNDDENINYISGRFFNNEKVIIHADNPTGSKISSINRDIELTNYIEWDILVNLSDDQVFIKKGFDEDIISAFSVLSIKENDKIGTTTISKNLDLFIHFPDGNQKDLSTMSIMGRDYFNRDEIIYNPEYISVYCDNEAQDVAKLRGCYKFVDEHIFNHLHPAWGKAENDAQYLKTEHPTVYQKDYETYQRHKSNNFYI